MPDSEKKLSERCPEMMALLRHSEDSIFFKNRKLQFALVSEAKAKRSGVSWEEMIGKTDFDFLPEEEAQRCWKDELWIMQTGEAIVDKEEELTRPDGTKSWVSVSKFPWRDVDGEIIGVIGISRDISERKELRENILRMLSIATHDMRGPLATVGMIISGLAKGLYGPVDKSVRETLGEVSQRLLRLEGIVRDYLTTSSILGAKVGAKEKLDLSQDIIEPIIEELTSSIKAKGLIIDNSFGGVPGNRIFVKANKSHLRIVYLNLFENAIRHTPPGGTIAFGFEDKEEIYRLNVYSSSTPINSDDKEKIFEMSVSGSGSTGLGLSIAREIMRKYNGDLWCEDALDGHPNFIIILPKEDE